VSDILNLAKVYMESVFDDSDWAPFTFHSIHHTTTVLEKALEWATACNLRPEESEAIQLAAMFHDLGYLTRYDNHESEGIWLFSVFAEENGIPADQQKVVKRLIECTRKTHSDFSIPLYKIMHDIDRVGMGMPDFVDQGLNLRKEWEHFKSFQTNDVEWFASQIEYLEKTKFKTDYGRSNYSDQKRKNLESLKRLLQDSSI
jgi:uncharacterized protein